MISDYTDTSSIGIRFAETARFGKGLTETSRFGSDLTETSRFGTDRIYVGSVYECLNEYGYRRRVFLRVVKYRGCRILFRT